MQLIYQNFDGLDVSFQGRLPLGILEELKAAKEEAQSRRADVPVRLTADGPWVLVAESGARGGYAYRFDTGPDGAVWFVAHNEDSTRWNIRVSVKSLNLALRGYAGVRVGLTDFLATLGATGPDSARPVPRVSRLDYCCDFIAPDFRPDPAAFIAHRRCSRSVHDQVTDRETNYRGRNIESIRIGTMPGRQVALYDKTREIANTNKPYWWDIWGLDKASTSGPIWRIEARAGKDELDTWNLRSFADLERLAGDVIVGTLKAIRYTSPTRDSNASRWPLHPLWSATIAAARDALAPYTSNAERRKVMEGLRAEVCNRVRNMLPGLCVAYTSLLGLDISELPMTLDRVAEDVIGLAVSDPEAISRKFLKAEERYMLLH